MTRWCPHCQTAKAWTEFQAAARDNTGQMIRPGAYCKPCLAARNRARRKTSPAHARAVDARDRDRIRTNPDQLAQRRETQRQNSAVWRERHRRTP